MTFQLINGALRRPARVALVALALGALGACDLDEVLNVPDPDVATPESVADASALPAVRAGALGDLQLALLGSGTVEDGLVQYTGMFADELVWAETFPTREQIDRRQVEIINGTMETLFANVQRARASAEKAADAYTRLAPDNPARSEMYSLAGFSYTLIAEAYCSGVPFSQLVDGAPVFGTGLTTTEMFERAVVLFDSALTTAPTAATSSIRQLAQVGKGRALMNLNRYTEAAAAVAGVSTGFVYNLETSENSTRQQNGVYVTLSLNRRFSPVGRDSNATNALQYRNEGDPRVIAPRGTGSQAVGFDAATPLYLNQKFSTRTAPFPLATGIKARLIEAESQLNRGTGNPLTALATLNTLRTAPGTAGSGGAAGLTPLVIGATAAEQIDQLFKERAYWLWLTSHRMGDLRRLVRQYPGRTEANTFPGGGTTPAQKAYFKGGSYGTDVNFPVPFNEQNNPNFDACINRDA